MIIAIIGITYVLFVLYSLASILKRGVVNHRYTYITESEDDSESDQESEQQSSDQETDFTYEQILLANLDDLDILELNSMLRQAIKLGLPNGRVEQIAFKLELKWKTD